MSAASVSNTSMGTASMGTASVGTTSVGVASASAVSMGAAVASDASVDIDSASAASVGDVSASTASAHTTSASTTSVQLRHTLRASTGTLIALGLVAGRCDVLPTTAYLLLGDGCRRACAFCAQSCRSSSTAGMLSRVSWPEVSVGNLLERLRLAGQAAGAASKEGIAPTPRQAPANGQCPTSLSRKGPASLNTKGLAPFQRICVQVTDCDGVVDDLKELVPLLKGAAPLQVSVSFKPRSGVEIEQLLAAGVDRLGIALDAADPQVFAEVKGGDYEQFKAYLLAAAAVHKDRISTHVIVGLGESEESAVRLIAECLQAGLKVGLFAFTPVKGTPMESRKQPTIGHYRRVQAASYLLRKDLVSLDDFQFADGRIASIGLDPAVAMQALNSGKAFETSGCDGCNRPYYNERPGSVMYNYPRPLQRSEIEQAIEATGLWRVDRS